VHAARASKHAGGVLQSPWYHCCLWRLQEQKPYIKQQTKNANDIDLQHRKTTHTRAKQIKEQQARQEHCEWERTIRKYIETENNTNEQAA
jgi:hypothetical protein